LLQDFHGSSLVVEVGANDDGMRVTVAVRAAADNWPSDGLEATMSWQIISALVLDPQASVTDVGPSISFGCPLPQ
jgi:hypothetical protein